MTVNETMNLVKELNKYLAENNFSEGAFTITDNTIGMEISWGDWKHDHLRANYLVGQFLEKKRIYAMHYERTTEEDGSDTYSADHTWTLFQY